MGDATEPAWFEEIGLSPDQEDQYRQQEQRAAANDGGVQFHQQVQQQEQESMEAERREQLISDGVDAFALLMVFGAVTRQNIGGDAGESMYASLSLLAGRMMGVLDMALELTEEETRACGERATVRAQELSGQFSDYYAMARATMSAPVHTPN